MASMFHNPIMLLAPIGPLAEGGEGSVSALVFYILIAIGASFLCSMLEAVLLSSSLSHVELAAQQGQKAGLLMQKHKQNVERPISAILTLNTIAHTVGAASAGAEAAVIFGSEWVGMISAVLTLLILIFSEIIPKTLGAVYWKPLMPFSAYTIQILVWLFYPAVWGFQAITRVIASGQENEPKVSRSEIQVMAQISALEGSLEEKEGRILKNLLQLNNVQVSDIMTPRTVMFALQQDMPVSEVIQKHRILPYARIPIFNDDSDDVTGFILRHDILKALAADEDKVQLKELRRPIHSIPETLSVTKALDEFILRQAHIFLVFDEYSGTAGILTMEDTIESLLGIEITDESDLVADLRKLAQERFSRQQKLLGLVADKNMQENNKTDQETID